MTFKKSALLLFIAILLPVLLLGFLWRGGEKAMRGQADAVLSGYGFTEATTGDIMRKDGFLAYTNIVLDPPDGFSTVSDIQTPVTLLDGLLRRPPGKVIINGASLTGEFNKESGLSIAGWSKRPLPVPAQGETILNSGKLDLDTPVGGLRFEAKGNLTRQPDGTAKLQAALWSVQNQVRLETKWSGLIQPDGRWAYEIEFENGGLNLEDIQASRMSGWLSIDRVKSVVPAVSGQIDAGKMKIGDIGLTNFSLTLSGPLTVYKLIASGHVAGYTDMTLTVDIDNKAEGPYVNASVETPSAADLFSFLTALQNSDTGAGHFTSLLLTKGNIERLQQEVKGLSFDSLELKIYGSAYDLAGNITAKKFKDGVEQSHVISLDPGGGAGRG